MFFLCNIFLYVNNLKCTVWIACCVGMRHAADLIMVSEFTFDGVILQLYL